MFHEDYYRIEEVANKLGITTHTLIKRAIEEKVQICVVLPTRVTDFTRRKKVSHEMNLSLLNLIILGVESSVETRKNFKKEEAHKNNSLVEVSIPLYPLIPYAIPAVSLIEFAKYSFSKPDIYHGGTCDQIECPDIQKIDDEGSVIEEYLYKLNGVKITPCNDIVVTHTELTRLLALKAEHDNKPTAEKLQQQLNEANALIAELEAAQTNDNKGKQKQREQALSYWIAGKGLDTAKRMTQSEVHDELKLVNGLFQIAPSTFEDFWQTQKLLKLDAGKR